MFAKISKQAISVYEQYMLNKMAKEVIKQSEEKKVWIAPELEVLDGKKTYGGEGGPDDESYWWVDDSDRLVS